MSRDADFERCCHCLHWEHNTGPCCHCGAPMFDLEEELAAQYDGLLRSNEEGGSVEA